MKEYHKILRRLISHPQETSLKLLRTFQSREIAHCKKCGVHCRPQIHSTDHRGIHKFYCTHCKQTFSELYGTMFYKSKVPLDRWFIVIIEWIMSTGSISGAEAGRKIGVKEYTGWSMLTRLRTEFASVFTNEQTPIRNASLFSTLLDGDVEADEAWMGKKHNNNQQIIFGAIERPKKHSKSKRRNLRLEIIDNVQEKTLYPLVEKHIQRGSNFFTDSRISYVATAVYYHHFTTNHSKAEFAKTVKDINIHSNSIEQIWGDIKGIIRTVHHGVSAKYRPLYLAQYIIKYSLIHSSNLLYYSLCQILHPTFKGR